MRENHFQYSITLNACTLSVFVSSPSLLLSLSSRLLLLTNIYCLFCLRWKQYINWFLTHFAGCFRQTWKRFEDFPWSNIHQQLMKYKSTCFNANTALSIFSFSSEEVFVFPFRSAVGLLRFYYECRLYFFVFFVFVVRVSYWNIVFKLKFYFLLWFCILQFFSILENYVFKIRLQKTWSSYTLAGQLCMKM